MKVIKILGTGCTKCQKTAALIKEVVDELGIEAHVQKVEDMMEIMQYNVLSTPVVVIDEEVEIKGRVPSKNEVIALLNQAS